MNKLIIIGAAALGVFVVVKGISQRSGTKGLSVVSVTGEHVELFTQNGYLYDAKGAMWL